MWWGPLLHPDELLTCRFLANMLRAVRKRGFPVDMTTMHRARSRAAPAHRAQADAAQRRDGIVHRDVSFSNIIVAESGVAN
jgi:hypothetical protein